MAAETLTDRAHELIGRLNPVELSAVVHLLEVIVHESSEEDEDVDSDEESAVARSKEWFRHHEGIPFEEVVSDLGFTMEQIRGLGKDPAA